MAKAVGRKGTRNIISAANKALHNLVPWQGKEGPTDMDLEDEALQVLTALKVSEIYLKRRISCKLFDVICLYVYSVIMDMNKAWDAVDYLLYLEWSIVVIREGDRHVDQRYYYH